MQRRPVALTPACMPILFFAYAVTGAALGLLRPAWAWAFMIAVVAVTPSLWWQLGLPNSALSLAYALAMLAAFALRRLVVRTEPIAAPSGSTTRRSIRNAVLATMVCTTAAASIGTLRRHPGSPRELLEAFIGGPESFFAFNPPGLVGELQAAAIALLGPVLLLATYSMLSATGQRALLRRAFLVAAAIATITPWVQSLVLNPRVRPDLGLDTSTGWVGFFQDPHSYASFLVLAIGLSSGLALGRGRDGAAAAAAGYAALSFAALVAVVGTGSRVGVVAALSVPVVLVAIWQLEARGRGSATRLVVFGGTLAGLALLMFAVLSIPDVKEAAYRSLLRIGPERLAQPLAPDADWRLMFATRRVRWERTLEVVATRPLWGAGPKAIQAIPMTLPHPATGDDMSIEPENTHNYYLQYAAEYGLPAAVALAWLIGLVGVAGLRAARAAPSALHRSLVAGFVAGQIGFLIIGLVAHPMLVVEGQLAFWTLSALGLSLADRDPAERTGHTPPESPSGSAPAA